MQGGITLLSPIQILVVILKEVKLKL